MQRKKIQGVAYLISVFWEKACFLRFDRGDLTFFR